MKAWNDDAIGPFSSARELRIVVTDRIIIYSHKSFVRSFLFSKSCPLQNHITLIPGTHALPFCEHTFDLSARSAYEPRKLSNPINWIQMQLGKASFQRFLILRNKIKSCPKQTDMTSESWKAKINQFSWHIYHWGPITHFGAHLGQICNVYVDWDLASIGSGKLEQDIMAKI